MASAKQYEQTKIDTARRLYATKVLLTFHESATKDECGNIWTPIGTPVIGEENSKFGSALQLDEQSGIVMRDGIELGGADFTIDFWMHLDEYSYGRLIDTIPRWFWVERSQNDNNQLIVRVDNEYGSYDSDAYIADNYPYYREYFDMDSDTFIATYVTEQNIENARMGQATTYGINSDYCYFYGGKEYGQEDDDGNSIGYFYLTKGIKHVAIIYSQANGFLGLFIDGSLEGFSDYRFTCERRLIKVQLGCRSDLTNFAGGTISEFRITDGIARWVTNENGALIKKVDIGEYIAKRYQWFTLPTKSERKLYRAEEHATFDTARQVLPRPKERATFDTRRHITAGFERGGAETTRRLIERARGRSTRSLFRKEKALADTVRRFSIALIIPTKESTSQPDYINSFAVNEIIEFSVTLQEHTLSDRFEMKTTKNIEIGQLVRGKLFDYEFSFLVESVHIENGIKTVTGMYNQDSLLYTSIYPQILINPLTEQAYGRGSKIQVLNPTDPNGETMEQIYAGAAYYVTEIANALGLTPVIAIRDFLPTQDFTASNTTYRDVLSTLFSWTSRVPRILVNVTIRGDYLFCLQRGFESEVVDISDIPHPDTQIDRTLVRSLFNTPLPDNGYAEKDEETPFTGSMSISDHGMSYSVQYIDGLLRSEVQTDLRIGEGGHIISKSNKSYDYRSIDGESYLSGKLENSTTENTMDDPPSKTYSTIRTSYSYNYFGEELYLTQELETTTTENWEGEKKDGLVQAGKWELVDIEESKRRTMHIPLGNGWYGTSVIVNGIPQGASISQGAPSNRISPYMVKSVQKSFPPPDPVPEANSDSDSDSDSDTKTVDEWRERLAPINDTTFPVEDEEYLTDLTNEIYWMNRKTAERVQVTLVSKVVNGVPEDDKIIDFNRVVRLDGQNYFLSSNQISLTPRRLTQRLSLVRWY